MVQEIEMLSPGAWSNPQSSPAGGYLVHLHLDAGAVTHLSAFDLMLRYEFWSFSRPWSYMIVQAITFSCFFQELQLNVKHFKEVWKHISECFHFCYSLVLAGITNGNYWNTARNSRFVRYPGQGIWEEHEPSERLSESKPILQMYFSDMSRGKTRHECIKVQSFSYKRCGSILHD